MPTKTKPEVGLKEIKADLLKAINKLNNVEQSITNLSIRIKRIEQRIGMPR
jgi:hypothetical protein